MSVEARRIARRYARALVALIDEGVDLRPGLKKLAALMKDPDAARFAASPAVKPEIKAETLAKPVGEMPKELRALLHLLAKRNKLALLPLIEEETEAILAAREKKARAEVVVAAPLSEEQRKKLGELVKRLAGAEEVALEVREDPDILGGLIVRIGDRLWDASLRSRLEAMRRAIAKAA
ncbi:MAG: ATP synthase F1 subunit delta [Zetaproteobacteria bacterium]|nr:MAG: ATP synthase F1 subunit delta [Zetaproteobacteria bacterium]